MKKKESNLLSHFSNVRVAKNLKSQLAERTRGQQLIDLRNQGPNTQLTIPKSANDKSFWNVDPAESPELHDFARLQDFNSDYSTNKCWN